jgi:hypothetical protein
VKDGEIMCLLNVGNTDIICQRCEIKATVKHSESLKSVIIGCSFTNDKKLYIFASGGQDV